MLIRMLAAPTHKKNGGHGVGKSQLDNVAMSPDGDTGEA